MRAQAIPPQADSGDISDTACVSSNGNQIVWLQHIVPEHHPGNSLNETEAQAIALEYAESTIDGPLKVVSSGPVKKLHRLDWTVTFTHGPKLTHPGFGSSSDAEEEHAVEGESRIELKLVDGKLAGWWKFIHVPEVWNRHERADKTAVQVILRGFSILYTLVSMGTGLAAIAAWGTRWGGKYQSGVFWRTLGLLMVLHAFITLNQFETMQHQFQTSQPWVSTAVQTVAQRMFGGFSRSLLTSFQFSLAMTLKPQRTDPQPGKYSIASFAPGLVLGLALVATHYAFAPMWERERPKWPGLVDANSAWPPIALLPLQVTLRFLHEVPTALLATTAATVMFPQSGDTTAPAPALSTLSSYFIPARLIVAAPMMLSSVMWDSLPAWLFSQVVTGLLTAWAFKLIYRHDLSQVPVASALGMHTYTYCHSFVSSPSPALQIADHTWAPCCVCSCGGYACWRMAAP